MASYGLDGSSIVHLQEPYRSLGQHRGVPRVSTAKGKIFCRLFHQAPVHGSVGDGLRYM